MTSTPDPRPLFAQALDQAGRLVAEVADADLVKPTPCPDFDVEDLLGHLVAVERRVAHIARGGQPFEVPSVLDVAPPEGWVQAWATAREDLDAVMADDDVLTRTFAHPAGEMPGWQATFAYSTEMATHTWDLAVALGRRDELDESIAAAGLDPVMRFLPAQPRGGFIPFGPVVEVPDDAAPYDRLAGWLGRDPEWTADTQAA